MSWCQDLSYVGVGMCVFAAVGVVMWGVVVCCVVQAWGWGMGERRNGIWVGWGCGACREGGDCMQRSLIIALVFVLLAGFASGLQDLFVLPAASVSGFYPSVSPRAHCRFFLFVLPAASVSGFYPSVSPRAHCRFVLFVLPAASVSGLCPSALTPGSL